MAFHITVFGLFPMWRILIGPLSYPGLVVYHYITRSLIVSYLSLATAGGLVQLGLVVRFERLVAVREELVMYVVTVGCFIITAAHLLLEAVTRYKLGLLHIPRTRVIIWLSQGMCDPTMLNKSGSGFLILPHVMLFFLSKLTLMFLKLHDRYPSPDAIVARYRLAIATSGANGRLTFSAYTILAIFIVMCIIFPLLPELDATDSEHLSFETYIFALSIFWLGCGSFLADAEPRHFIFRRLGRAWVRRAGRGAGEKRGRCGVLPERVELKETGDSRSKTENEVKVELPGPSNSIRRSQRTQIKEWHTSTGLGECETHIANSMPDIHI